MYIESTTWIVTTIVSIVAIMTTLFVSMAEIRNTNRQLLEQTRNDFFERYTKRYQDIILAMPDDVYNGTAELDEKTLKYVQLYFDLCNEEYYLYKRGYIPQDIWTNWFGGMVIMTTSHALFANCWDKLKAQYRRRGKYLCLAKDHR